MINRKLYLLTLGLFGLLFAKGALATNPLIMDQFTADPTARVFDGQVYLYASHDIPYRPGRGRTNWFIMEDYHVFSSSNLMDWTDHGVLLNQTNVPWLTRYAFNMWAPDCVFKNGKYYFYFPTGGRIGVAVADRPDGPFQPEDKPIAGVAGIDPCVLIDEDGSAYLFWARGRISVAKLKDNMLELASPPQVVANLPQSGLIEGPFAFERKGVYYLTYPHAVIDAEGQQGAERLEYSMATNVWGPYKWTGVITDTNESGCWTEQDSIVQYEGQWHLFYHDNQLSPNFDKNRSVRVDDLQFNADGTIQKVLPTLRGVGIADATSRIQIDRYSAISKEGVLVSFLNPTNTFEGWKISLDGKNTWVRFDRVDFGNPRSSGEGGLKSVNARAVSATGGTLEIHVDKVDGPVLARIHVGPGTEWNVVNATVVHAPSGVHDLIITHDEDSDVDLDWASFE